MRALHVASSALLVAIVSLPLAALRSGGPICTATPHVEQVGASTAGSFGAPTLSGVGTPEVGVPGSFHFEIDGGFPSAPGVLFLARHEQPTFSSTFSTTLWTGPFTVAVPFQCDSNGHASVYPGRTNSALASLCGLNLIAQATVFDFTGPGGATWTNGLRFRFGASVLGG